jgi:hypothetical protein
MRDTNNMSATTPPTNSSRIVNPYTMNKKKESNVTSETPIYGSHLLSDNTNSNRSTAINAYNRFAQSSNGKYKLMKDITKHDDIRHILDGFTKWMLENDVSVHLDLYCNQHNISILTSLFISLHYPKN